MNIDELLEFDETDPRDRLADYLVASDEKMVADLVKRRAHLGLTLQQVAARMGIDKSGVSRIERGGRDLQLSTLRRYAMALDAVIHHEVHGFDAVDGATRARLHYKRPSFDLRSSLSSHAPAPTPLLERELVGARIYG